MAGLIVVVEDEADIRDLICVLLREEGYVVLCLSSPGLLAGLSPDAHPVLFLLDLMLPMITGIEVARRLRHDAYQDTAMIAMSASPALLADAQTSGLFNGTLAKPFDLGTLLDVAERYAA